MSEMVERVVREMQHVWGGAADDDPPPLEQLARAAIAVISDVIEEVALLSPDLEKLFNAALEPVDDDWVNDGDSIEDPPISSMP